MALLLDLRILVFVFGDQLLGQRDLTIHLVQHVRNGFGDDQGNDEDHVLKFSLIVLKSAESDRYCQR